MKTIKRILFTISLASIISCSKESPQKKQIALAEQQFTLLANHAKETNRIPRTEAKDGTMHFTHNGKFDWTEGFFPGSCWYLYGLTKNEKWKEHAIYFQNSYKSHKDLTSNHDLGFVFNCSYGNGYRMTHDASFKQVLIDAAKALSTRFNPTVGCIKSWDITGGWQAKKGWKYPVIIDNMMNLELLFEASILSGDETYKNIAITHANTTLKNHYRENNSSYHVIDYDPETGAVRNKHTAQGFAHTSSWARGQAWGLYGYTLCYRYTKDKKYLDQAVKIAAYITKHESIPSDGIPYWDYNAATIPNEPKDVSAAAVTVSALIELDTYTETSYSAYINNIMNSLASSTYFAKIGENNHFLLKHSTGSIPHNNEIDVPLIYADYYYLEALYRIENAKQ